MWTACTLYGTHEIKSGTYLPSRFAESNFTSLLLLKGTRVMCIHVRHVYRYIPYGTSRKFENPQFVQRKLLYNITVTR